MRKIMVLVSFMILSTGCMSQKSEFPVVPEVTSTAAVQGASVVGLAPVKDDRGNDKAGHIGGLRIRAGTDAPDYVRRAMKNKLTEKGFRVVDVPDPATKPDAYAQPAARAVTVVPILQAASITTADAIMFAAAIHADLAAQVYDDKGAVAFVKKAHGEYKERLWFSVGTKKIGTRLATAIDKAIDEIIQDPKFLEALTAAPQGAARPNP